MPGNEEMVPVGKFPAGAIIFNHAFFFRVSTPLIASGFNQFRYSFTIKFFLFCGTVDQFRAIP